MLVRVSGVSAQKKIERLMYDPNDWKRPTSDRHTLRQSHIRNTICKAEIYESPIRFSKTTSTDGGVGDAWT